MLPAKRTGPAQNAALEAVLARLIGPQPDRADTPDGWITAIRRQPAADGEFAPFPDWSIRACGARWPREASSSCTATRPRPWHTPWPDGTWW